MGQGDSFTWQDLGLQSRRTSFKSKIHPQLDGVRRREPTQASYLVVGLHPLRT